VNAKAVLARELREVSRRLKDFPASKGKDEDLRRDGVASRTQGSTAYIDPMSKNPDTLAGVVSELEELANWMQNTLGSIKMRELRSRVIKVALAVKGCANTWELERKNMPWMRKDVWNPPGPIHDDGPAPEDVPMPGRNSSDFNSIRRELESIAYAVSNKLMPCHTDYPKADFEVHERLKNLVNITRRLQKLWLADEHAIREAHCKRPDYQIPAHKLLFFGPDNGGTELARDMKEQGVRPESKMAGCLNLLAEEGWRVVHRSYNADLAIKQWRVMLEKP